MSGKVIGIGIVCIIVLVFVWLVCAVIGVSNREVTLRTTIETKQKDNTSEFDNMWKKISQVAQVTEGQKNAIMEIMVGYANARSQGRDGAGSFVNALHEAIPNVDTTTFNNLQNIIVASRDAFTFRQKELLDLSREHTILLRRFPEGAILTFMGRKTIDVTIVTSSRTEKAFATGKDDDTDVFKPKPAAAPQVEKSL